MSLLPLPIVKPYRILRTAASNGDRVYIRLRENAIRRVIRLEIMHQLMLIILTPPSRIAAQALACQQKWDDDESREFIFTVRHGIDPEEILQRIGNDIEQIQLMPKRERPQATQQEA